MFRGFYTAASGMYAQQRRTEMLTNNLANMNTPGYKEDQATIRAFPEMLLQSVQRTSQRTKREVGSINAGVYMQEILPRFIQGDLRETNISTDLALKDETTNPVFFVIERDGEIRYTRNGSFTLDAEGMLTTAEGYPVLDSSGNPIYLENDQFTVTTNGTIEQGELIIPLGIVVAENPAILMKEGNGLYRTENDEVLPYATENDYKVYQGFLEGSNVNPTQTITEMLAALRTFEANQKVLQAYDRSMEKAVNDIGRVGM